MNFPPDSAGAGTARKCLIQNAQVKPQRMGICAAWQSCKILLKNWKGFGGCPLHLPRFLRPACFNFICLKVRWSISEPEAPLELINGRWVSRKGERNNVLEMPSGGTWETIFFRKHSEQPFNNHVRGRQLKLQSCSHTPWVFTGSHWSH